MLVGSSSRAMLALEASPVLGPIMTVSEMRESTEVIVGCPRL